MQTWLCLCTSNYAFRLRAENAASLIPTSAFALLKSASYFYPDLSIVCDEPQIFKDSDDIPISPIVLAEVLSPSTSDCDYGTKFIRYREIPSLEEYILVHTDAILIEQYTRQSSDSWLLSEHAGLDAALSLPSIDCSVNLRAVYEDAIE